jgi:5-methylcytosine-specific restriction enzyme B
MRRRFVFVSMDSSEPALAEVLSRWCEANDMPHGLVQLRDRLNARMLERGLDPALAFGPSYFMRTSLSDPRALRRLWWHELRPMLREHHYADDEALAGYRFEAWCADLGLSLTDGEGRADPQ